MLTRLTYFGLVFLALTIMSAPSPVAAEANDPALEAYHRAVAAETLGEREQAIEQALEIYLGRFNEMKAEGEINGMLCYNIGNCYFILQQLGEAIYYYRLGLTLLPGNEKIQGNLQVALNQRQDGIDVESSPVKETLLFFHYKVSTAERIMMLIISAIVASVLLIGLIFRRGNTFFRYSAGISSLLFLSFLLSIAAEYYFPNHIGVVVDTADVRRDAGEGFAPITTKPFTSGSSLRVLSLADGWYQVKLNDGRKGFVEQDRLKIVM